MIAAGTERAGAAGREDAEAAIPHRFTQFALCVLREAVRGQVVDHDEVRALPAAELRFTHVEAGTDEFAQRLRGAGRAARVQHGQRVLHGDRPGSRARRAVRDHLDRPRLEAGGLGLELERNERRAVDRDARDRHALLVAHSQAHRRVRAGTGQPNPSTHGVPHAAVAEDLERQRMRRRGRGFDARRVHRNAAWSLRAASGNANAPSVARPSVTTVTDADAPCGMRRVASSSAAPSGDPSGRPATTASSAHARISSVTEPPNTTRVRCAPAVAFDQRSARSRAASRPWSPRLSD